MKNKTAYSELIVYVLVIVGIVFLFDKTYQFFEQHIKRVNCEVNISALREAIVRFKTYRPEDVVDNEGQIKINLLMKEKFIPMYITCPSGGSYKQDKKGQVFCTIHGYYTGGR